MKKAKTFTIAVMTVVGATLGAPAVAAGGGDNCDFYAFHSVKQQQRNEELKCGFKEKLEDGATWSANQEDHKKWCGTVSPREWRAALKEREEMLKNQCKKP